MAFKNTICVFGEVKSIKEKNGTTIILISKSGDHNGSPIVERFGIIVYDKQLCDGVSIGDSIHVSGQFQLVKDAYISKNGSPITNFNVVASSISQVDKAKLFSCSITTTGTISSIRSGRTCIEAFLNRTSRYIGDKHINEVYNLCFDNESILNDVYNGDDVIVKGEVHTFFDKLYVKVSAIRNLNQ